MADDIDKESGDRIERKRRSRFDIPPNIDIAGVNIQYNNIQALTMPSADPSYPIYSSLDQDRVMSEGIVDGTTTRSTSGLGYSFHHSDSFAESKENNLANTIDNNTSNAGISKWKNIARKFDSPFDSSANATTGRT